jgi:hypothetical protein
MNKSTQSKVKLIKGLTPFAFRVYSSTLALFIALFINTLASFSAFNGLNTGEVSDLYPSLLTPTGFTFSIWGVIYSALIYFSVDQIRTIQTLEFSTSRERIFKVHGWYFLISMLNAMWIILWQYQIIFGSMIVIIAMLYALIQIVLLLRKQSFLLRLPFSLYAGWITVATVANMTTYLISTDYVSNVTIAWNQPGAVIQTVMLLIILTAIAAVWIVREKDVVIGGVVIWTLLGIAYRHWVDFDRAYITVFETSILLIGVLIGWTIFVWLKNQPLKLIGIRK